MFARQLNPAETQAYEAQFMVLPPEHQADVAMVWRERCIDVLSEMVNPGSALIGAFVGASYGALLGAWSGRGEAEAFALTEEWKAAGAASKGIDPADHPTPFKTITDKSGNVIHERVGDPANLADFLEADGRLLSLASVRWRPRPTSGSAEPSAI